MRDLSNSLEARTASDELRRDKDDVFLYIHGFNNPFSKALRKTAQLTLDLGFKGIPMSYSWPAQNVTVPMPWDFRTDANSIEKSLPQFNNFLKELRRNIHREKDQCLHLVAHSMGSRALARILNLISYEEKDLMKDPQYIKPFCEVILVAPAIDAEIFIKTNSANLAKVSDRVTIYASSDDVALNLQWLAEDESFTFPLGSKSSEGYLALSPAIETIDLSNVSVGPWSFNHSKYSELPQVEDDIRDLIIFRLGAQDRLARGAKLIKKFMKALFLMEPEQLHFWEMAPK
jgi:esterase/lipase superfamily enzyme